MIDYIVPYVVPFLDALYKLVTPLLALVGVLVGASVAGRSAANRLAFDAKSQQWARASELAADDIRELSERVADLIAMGDRVAFEVYWLKGDKRFADASHLEARLTAAQTRVKLHPAADAGLIGVVNEFYPAAAKCGSGDDANGLGKLITQLELNTHRIVSELKKVRKTSGTPPASNDDDSQEPITDQKETSK